MVPLPLVPLAHLDALPEPDRKYRLMEVVRRVLREQRYSKRTEEADVAWIIRYIKFHGRRHPRDLDAVDVQEKRLVLILFYSNFISKHGPCLFCIVEDKTGR